MANFSLREVQWLSTLWVNFLRSFGTGLIFGVIFAFVHAPNGPSPLLPPIVLPIAYFLFYAPLALAASFLGRFIPLVGILALPAYVCTLPGDPLVYILWKIKPELVPLEKCGLFTFHAILFVTQNPNARDYTATLTPDHPEVDAVTEEERELPVSSLAAASRSATIATPPLPEKASQVEPLPLPPLPKSRATELRAPRSLLKKGQSCELSD